MTDNSRPEILKTIAGLYFGIAARVAEFGCIASAFAEQCAFNPWCIDQWASEITQVPLSSLRELIDQDVGLVDLETPLLIQGASVAIIAEAIYLIDLVDVEEYYQDEQKIAEYKLKLKTYETGIRDRLATGVWSFDPFLGQVFAQLAQCIDSIQDGGIAPVDEIDFQNLFAQYVDPLFTFRVK